MWLRFWWRKVLMLKPGVRRVNSVGAKVLEFIAHFGKPTAPLPAAIVGCVPTKAGETEFKISPTEITDAMKAGLDQPIMPEPEDEEHENKGKDESCDVKLLKAVHLKGKMQLTFIIYFE
ncbi:stromal processing peptidase, chloroplastic-like [Arachis hypogaea]|uniref:stromal processing peptidase, chloroplastic-like n=1 Tax=Arachis hypogaea TaxID=3818 RepID=UPI0007AF2FB9|nr:uncharacterized protein DS421_13g442860 [Arachis hypogaea]